MSEFNPLDELQLVKVLYVEDEEDIREEIEEFLELEVGELIIAKNGQDGLEKFKEHSPDVVITDIQMPVMDGLKMAQEIKKIDKLTPIIVTTAFNENDYLLKSINIGIDKYVLKPIDLNILIDAIFKSVENKILQDKLKAKKEYINFILDTTPNFMVVSNGEDLEYINQTLLSYLGYQSLDEFKKNHACLDDFFCRRDGEQYEDNSTNSWIKHVIENPNIEHIAYLCNKSFSDCTIRPYLIKYNAFAKFNKFVFSFTDISQLNIAKPFLRGKNKSEGISECYSKRQIDLLLFSESQKAKKYDGKLSIALIKITSPENLDIKISTEIKMDIYKKIKDIDIIAKIDSNNFLLFLAGIDFKKSIKEVNYLIQNLKNSFKDINFESLVVDFKNEMEFSKLKRNLVDCKI